VAMISISMRRSGSFRESGRLASPRHSNRADVLKTRLRGRRMILGTSAIGGERREKMRLVPLGDQSILAYFDEESAAVSFAGAVRAANPPWFVEVVPA